MVNQTLRDKPYKYIQKAISMLRPNSIIVEIGSMRQFCYHPLDGKTVQPCCNDGHSTLLFAQSGHELYTVDIDKRNYEITTASVLGSKNVVHAFCQDGVEFLKQYNGRPIDLLFLDAWDVDTWKCAESHLEAYQASQDKLNPDYHIVSIDDTDVDFEDNQLVWNTDGVGGKGKLLVPYLLKKGYKLIDLGRQTILLWEKS